MSASRTTGRSRVGRGLAIAAVAISTALVIVGVSIALFFNPVWVSFAQGRTDAPAFTGWTSEQVDAVTRDIVIEVWLGPGDFDQDVAGRPVFEARERSHMSDVRGVVLSFYALVLAALARAADGADHVGQLAELFDVGTVELLGQDDVKRLVVAIKGGDAMGGVGSGLLGVWTRGIYGLHVPPQHRGDQAR